MLNFPWSDIFFECTSCLVMIIHFRCFFNAFLGMKQTNFGSALRILFSFLFAKPHCILMSQGSGQMRLKFSVFYSYVSVTNLTYIHSIKSNIRMFWGKICLFFVWNSARFWGSDMSRCGQKINSSFGTHFGSTFLAMTTYC